MLYGAVEMGTGLDGEDAMDDFSLDHGSIGQSYLVAADGPVHGTADDHIFGHDVAAYRGPLSEREYIGAYFTFDGAVDMQVAVGDQEPVTWSPWPISEVWICPAAGSVTSM